MYRLLQSIVVAVAALTLTMPAVPHPKALQTQEVITTAKIVLNAPSSARVGELVRLDASESAADSFKWVLVPESVDFEVYAEGRKAVFSARAPGEFLFVIAVAKDGAVDVITHRIVVVGPPDEPQDVADVAGHIRYWLWTTQGTEAERLALATAFEEVAAMGLSDRQAWMYETKRKVEEALGDAKPKWDGFLKKVGHYMSDLGNAGVMLEPEEHARVWREIAATLREGL